MTAEQFAALATLLRLRPGPPLDAARLVLVDGLSIPDAARQAGAVYALAYKTVQRANKGLDLAGRVCGPF